MENESAVDSHDGRYREHGWIVPKTLPPDTVWCSGDRNETASDKDTASHSDQSLCRGNSGCMHMYRAVVGITEKDDGLQAVTRSPMPIFRLN